MNNNVYDVDYFINKFSNIPEEEWCIGSYVSPLKDKFCAFGHCGCGSRNPKQHNKAEIKALQELSAFFDFRSNFANINDNNEYLYKKLNKKYSELLTQLEKCNGPKERVLCALNYIKSHQTPLLTNIVNTVNVVEKEVELEEEEQEEQVVGINNENNNE